MWNKFKKDICEIRETSEFIKTYGEFIDAVDVDNLIHFTDDELTVLLNDINDLRKVKQLQLEDNKKNKGN